MTSFTVPWLWIAFEYFRKCWSPGNFPTHQLRVYTAWWKDKKYSVREGKVQADRKVTWTQTRTLYHHGEPEKHLTMDNMLTRWMSYTSIKPDQKLHLTAENTNQTQQLKTEKDYVIFFIHHLLINSYSKTITNMWPGCARFASFPISPCTHAWFFHLVLPA